MRFYHIFHARKSLEEAKSSFTHIFSIRLDDILCKKGTNILIQEPEMVFIWGGMPVVFLSSHSRKYIIKTRKMHNIPVNCFAK